MLSPLKAGKSDSLKRAIEKKGKALIPKIQQIRVKAIEERLVLLLHIQTKIYYY